MPGVFTKIALVNSPHKGWTRGARVGCPNGRTMQVVCGGHGEIDTAVTRPKKIAEDGGSGDLPDAIADCRLLESRRVAEK